MPKIDVYDIEGKKVKTIELKEEVFGIEPNEALVHSVLVNYLANQRQGTQSTKTRAEVSGGGRKPWRQKGTGRARQGSIRAPHWVGGGIALGPKPRSYSYKLNKKERRLAIKSCLSSKVIEDNYVLNGNIRYSKTWKNSLTLTGALSNDYKHYTDNYDGTAIGKQHLSSNITVGLLQLSKYSEKYYYYISAGLSNTAVSLNSIHNNYCMPVAFYGGNYVINNKHSLSLNGLFTHTLFEPSEKNSMVVPTSFFEATCGNPDIAPMKVLGNTLSYNGQIGKIRLSLSYDSNIYFDNIVHQYTANTNTIFDTRINGGTFYGNMFTVGCAYNLFNEHLRLSATVIEECNTLKGATYDMSHNSFRIKGGLVYLAGEWMLSFDYQTPYKSLDIRQPWFIQRRPTYEWKVSWTHKALAIEALVRNPFSRYDKQHITMDYGCYNRNSRIFNEINGRNINLTLTYNLSYGKKSERGEIEVNP